MPTMTDSRLGPGDEPGVEARLRAELGAGGLPTAVRQRHLARLQALTEELGPAAGDGGRAPRPGETPATARARPRWFTASAPPRAAAASVAMLAVLVFGTGSAVAASMGALPGEALYPVKQAVERVQVAASWSAAREVAAYLDAAETRLDEAGRLAAGEGQFDELAPTLDRHEAALASAAEQAGDDAELTRAVDEATAAAAVRLARLLDELSDTAPPQARAALSDALQRLEGRLPQEPQPDARPGTPERSPEGDEPAPAAPEPPPEPQSPPQRGPSERPSDPPSGDRGDQGPGPSQDRGVPQEPGARDNPGPPADPGEQSPSDNGDAPRRDQTRPPDDADQPGSTDGAAQRGQTSRFDQAVEANGGPGDAPGGQRGGGSASVGAEAGL